MERYDIESKISELESVIAEKHLSVGYAEAEVDSLTSELQEAECKFEAELSELEEMEEELSKFQDRLNNFDEEEESKEIYSYGSGQIQVETLFDNFDEYE